VNAASSATWNSILDMLDERVAPRHLFHLGLDRERYPQIVRRIVAEGHELASHGYGHERASDLSRNQPSSRHHAGQAVLEDLSGVPSRATARRAFPSARATCGPLTAWSAPATATVQQHLPDQA
jgi:peptidoglycan/xylan/chitin deacetylase (PgdA/CDA1 family)